MQIWIIKFKLFTLCSSIFLYIMRAGSWYHNYFKTLCFQDCGRIIGLRYDNKVCWKILSSGNLIVTYIYFDCYSGTRQLSIAYRITEHLEVTHKGRPPISIFFRRLYSSFPKFSEFAIPHPFSQDTSAFNPFNPISICMCCLCNKKHFRISSVVRVPV